MLTPETRKYLTELKVQRDEALAETLVLRAQLCILRLAFEHTHVGPDERCATCGLTLRNPVHVRAG